MHYDINGLRTQKGNTHYYYAPSFTVNLFHALIAYNVFTNNCGHVSVEALLQGNISYRPYKDKLEYLKNHKWKHKIPNDAYHYLTAVI